MSFLIIYDGNCNLCVSLVQLLEKLDQGKQFSYAPMQDEQTLAHYQIAPDSMQNGVVLLDLNQPELRWQGSTAVEEIARHLPAGLASGEALVNFYRQLTPLKWLGDRIYGQVRDHRYQLFGGRSTTYFAEYSPTCTGGSCPKEVLSTFCSSSLAS